MSGMTPSTDVLNYQLLRHALERFHCRPAELSARQRAEAEGSAAQSLALESRVLGSPEGAATVIPAEQVEAAVARVRERYPDEATFRADLDANGIGLDGLREALARELRFDAVMTRIGAAATEVTAAEVAAWYHAHPERTASPERRQVRHILITLNPDFAENRRDVALARMKSMLAELADDPARFEALARKHSECPSALEGGRLGIVAAGQLYPALDRELFSLKPGALSGIVESEIGLHLLWCEAVEPARKIALEDARDKIRAALQNQRRRETQQAWIQQLTPSI